MKCSSAPSTALIETCRRLARRNKDINLSFLFFSSAALLRDAFAAFPHPSHALSLTRSLALSRSREVALVSLWDSLQRPIRYLQKRLIQAFVACDL